MKSEAIQLTDHINNNVGLKRWSRMNSFEQNNVACCVVENSTNNNNNNNSLIIIIDEVGCTDHTHTYIYIVLKRLHFETIRN